MDDPLDDVAFLARSENRIALLEALSDERSHSRDELMATVEVSRPTLARILDDLERRAWITQHGQDSRITSLGAWVLEEFTDLLDTMDTAEQLRDVTRWFPAEDTDFDVVRRLRDAEIVFATESDPMAPIRRSGEQVRTGTRLRFLTTQVTVSYLVTVRESVVENDLTVDGVVTPDVFETLTDDADMAVICTDLYDSEHVTLFVTVDRPPILQLVDGDVGIGLIDAASTPRGLVLTDDRVVLEWAEEIFESYRADAARVTADQFAALRETDSSPEQLDGLLDAS